MAELKIVRKGNSLNKLTIAKGRIELKLQDDVQGDAERWLRSFAELVVADAVIHLPLDRTLRGRFKRTDKIDRWGMVITLSIHDQGKVKVMKNYYSHSMGLSEPPVTL